ncbi:pilus assembly protein TadF [Aggregatibacter actinomycetemcomitans]|uniref:tight adherence pilus pseudopilin TadF n=1 Tax=Aggregatibacter actinomycetemcomitans TaxID=714 RepID=UPI00197B475E|nr:tight adherence pilus pseudopilin TadF [Aggregatibacter actinomycetemcomitans]MBN6075261.1 pilus assembly protein TadF [Aggregatibacter actinomycetemcomitans]
MKDYFFSNSREFRINKKGSVTIEFVFMLVLLTFVFAFLADFVMIRVTQGKLDNASYSLVNILRERAQLYDDDGTKALTQNDLNEYEELAKLILFGDKKSGKKVGVRLEHWWQKDGKSAMDEKYNIQNCQPYKKLDNQLAHLSPLSETVNKRKVPMYQVTLCVDINSFFQSLVVKKENLSFGSLSSSSIAVARAKSQSQ